MNVKITTALNWLGLVPTIMLFVMLVMDAPGIKIWNDFARFFCVDPAVLVGHIGVFFVWPVFAITLINLIIALGMKRFVAAFIAFLLLFLNFFVASTMVAAARAAMC